MSILLLFSICFCVRLISLFKSIFNEKRLIKEGAEEYGKQNSITLTLAHILFYGLCLTEGLVNEVMVNKTTYVGLAIYTFSLLVLLIVIIQLGKVWTVKLYIAKNHIVNNSPLFKYVKHPNYYLNVIPELIGMALICNAFITLLIGLPLYLIPLVIRIKQEEDVMRSTFEEYK